MKRSKMSSDCQKDAYLALCLQSFAKMLDSSSLLQPPIRLIGVKKKKIVAIGWRQTKLFSDQNKNMVL